MTRWIFESGHTGAEFRIRHMMVAWVRGHFKDIHGHIDFDPQDPLSLSVEAQIDADKIWTGQAARDEHLKSADFLDVRQYPKITFKGGEVRALGENEFQLSGDFTLHGVTMKMPLNCRYLGHWQTPYWMGNRDYGPVGRIGFMVDTLINRFDFGVNWQDQLPGGGVVVGPDVYVTVDVEAILEADLERIERERAA